MISRSTYFHSASRPRTQAWPTSEDADEFVAFDPRLSASVSAKRVPPASHSMYFAHSYGAVVAALAHRAHRAAALVFVEPAFYDLARGEPSVETHIQAIEDAHGALQRDGLWAFWQRVRPLMFGGPASSSSWERERATAESFSARSLPWGHGIDLEWFAGTPTLVVTGGWNEQYEIIAARFIEVGAEHLVLPGHGHRPMDHPEFVRAVSEFRRGC